MRRFVPLCVNPFCYELHGSYFSFFSFIHVIFHFFSFYSQGTKIHASVRKQLLYVFQSKLNEGKVYQMSCFYVAPSVGSYRTTSHPYKIVFQMTTKVQVCEGPSIPSFGISLCKIADVCKYTSDHDYLVGN